MMGYSKNRPFIKVDVTGEVDKRFDEVTSQMAEIPIDTIKKKYLQRRTALFNPNIVAYGDSNTRYYEGDRATNGSVTHAYSSWIDRKKAEYPNFYNSTVTNRGNSGYTIQQGLQYYDTNVTDFTPNIVIVGFGTNNIKNENETLEVYINNMTTMIDNLLNAGIVPIVLGIPWFDISYVGGNTTIHNRLPVWNNALIELCISKNIEFVDAYKMFTSSYSDVWFNEVTTPKRHYSKIAQKILGEELMNRIINLNYLAPQKGDLSQNYFKANSINWFESVGTATFGSFSLGLDAITAMIIPVGTSVDFKVAGRYSVSFYPREVATANITYIGDVSITNAVDDGLYYPIKVASKATSDLTGGLRTITVTSVSGTLYVRGIYAEQRS